MSVNHTQDAFSSSIPTLTASNFNAMQNLATASAFNFNFNSFIKGSIATQSFVYFTITNGQSSRQASL